MGTEAVRWLSRDHGLVLGPRAQALARNAIDFANGRGPDIFTPGMECVLFDERPAGRGR